MDEIEKAAIGILEALLGFFGADFVRKQADKWEAERAASNVAFEAKFGEKP